MNSSKVYIDGVLQAGIARLYGHDTRGLRSTIVWRESYVLAVPADDPLAQRTRVKLSSCQDHEFLFFPRATAPALYDGLVDRLGELGLRPRIRAEFPDKREIVALAAAGYGVGLVPESSARGAPDGVVFVGIRDRLPPVEVSLISGPEPSAGVNALLTAWKAQPS